MVLTKEERVALLAKAREAKAKKRVSVKDETEDEEETPVINVPMPEPEPEPPKVKKTRKKNDVVPLPVPVEVIQVEEEEPLPVPKKKVVPNPKWLKNPKTEVEKVCCDKKLTKEQPVIDDAPQIVAETIVIPAKKEIKKPRQPRASAPTRTLELTPPRDIVDVIDELKVDNQKYLPKIRQAPPSTPTAPISIVRSEPALRLFDY